MYKVYLQTDQYDPLFISVVSQGQILATMLAVIQRERLGVFSRLTARAIIIGGPIVKNDNQEILEFLLKGYNKLVKGKAIYSQVRNLNQNSKNKSTYFKYGFQYEKHLNILIDLNKGEEILWSEVHSKRRNEIRRAKREKTEFFLSDDENDLKKCYLILESVYRRAKLPLPPYQFFYNLFKINGEKIGLKIFCAVNQDKIIGCLLGLVYRNNIFDFYAGAQKEYYKKYPNDLLPWEIFLWGIKNDYSTFDFGGAGKPDIPYGVRDYKKKFGGEIVEFGRYTKIHQPILMNLGKVGMKIWKYIK